MGANKKKTTKKEVSGAVSSSSTGGDTQRTESVVVTTQQVPVVVERLFHQSPSSNVVTKSTSSTKVSSSSQEQNFYSTSSTTSSSSKAQKSGKTQQLQSQSDAFLRGERSTGDIDARTAKNQTILLESVDLHNVAGDLGRPANLDNLVSIEIQSKDSRAASSSSELVTNTLSTTKSINDGNRSDVITVESGRKSGETTNAVSGLSRVESSSIVQGSSNVTSSSTFQSSTTVDGVTDVKEMHSSDFKNAATSKVLRNGKLVDSKNVSDSGSTFTSKGFDGNTSYSIEMPASPHPQTSSNVTGGSKSPGFSPSGPTKVLRNGKLVTIEGTDETTHKVFDTKSTNRNQSQMVFDDNTSETVRNRSQMVVDDNATTSAVSSHDHNIVESSSTVQASSNVTSSSTFQSSTTVDGVTDVKEMHSSDFKNAATSKVLRNGKLVDSKNVSDAGSTFTSKGFDGNTSYSVEMPASPHPQSSQPNVTGAGKSPRSSTPSGPTKVLRNGKLVTVEGSDDTSRVFDRSQKLIDDSATTLSSHNRDVNESSSIVHGSTTATSSSTRQQFSSSTVDGVTDAKEVKSSAFTNAASSKVLRNGRLVDSKNIADTTTTFTSKVFDDKTKSWVVVEQSSVNETDVLLPSVQQPIDSASPNSKMNTMTISSTAAGIDSTSSTKVDRLSSSNKAVKSDVQTSSKTSKEVLEKNMSSKKQSSRDEKLVSTSTSETVQVFDNKTKTWKTVDASAINQQRRPSYMRYRSQNDDGTWHTVYKRKLYDEFSKSWKIVDERVVSSEDHSRMTEIPEMIENATNITTTTYTTKIYDTKTGKWTIVDEKSYVDTEAANVTQDIKREIERDQPDLANIITTTETTKVGKRKNLP